MTTLPSYAYDPDQPAPAYSNDPDKAWSILRLKVEVREVKPLDPASPKPEGHTRFVCISDTHTRTDKLVVPPGDVLVHAGDFSNIGLPKDVDKFRRFLEDQPHPHKVIIAGNHDLTFDTDNYDSLWRRFSHPQKYNSQELKDSIARVENVTYLEDSGTTINGIRIWGSPWQPEFGDWGFNLPRGEKCLEKWRLIPAGVDVLITHGPPLGYGDQCKGGSRAGCVQLLNEVQMRVKPKYHVFGHIHEGYGVTTDGQTVFINASSCNFYYRPVNPPIVFDLPNT